MSSLIAYWLMTSRLFGTLSATSQSRIVRSACGVSAIKGEKTDNRLADKSILKLCNAERHYKSFLKILKRKAAKK